jgi:uncharacterized protein with FMN-binding domain
MNRKIPAALTLAMATAPTATAWSATYALAAAPSASAASTRKVVGPYVSMRFGPVRVAITINAKKITAVQASYPTSKPRSQRINSHAIPILRSEVLRAQSANIAVVSGATLTTKAYKSSLASAIRTAHI